MPLDGATGGRQTLSHLDLCVKKTDQQLNDLLTSDERGFVTAVRNCIVSAHPKLGDDPELLDRLTMAYDEGKRMGLTEDELLAKFLWLETEVPGFYGQPAISNWLEKPGAPVDDRFKDLLAVLRKKLVLSREDH
ncbi:hypothetical protein B0G57_12369 [Trinickia symbiotica]|uniref:hypothetical protein n=1 Tax=Trinickia symbiotica TaxID=863227 RepID=UPI000D439FAC|nr:hypothetical protein [Trinickia symbiotica]PPK41974.1 hypothetical protein B0G57_12369 [Trinickia symbiotica]